MTHRQFIQRAAALAALATLIGAPAAHAQAITFGGYTVAAAGPAYTFTNNGGTSATLVSLSVPVTFDFDVPNGYGAVGQPIAATLTLTAQAFSPATATTIPFLGITYLSQPVGLAGQPISLMLKANTPVGGKSDLLTVTGQGDLVSGLQGGQNASFQGDSAAASLGSSVGFMSDFLSFGGSKAFNVGFTSVAPALSIGPGGFLNSFTASGPGSFSADMANRMNPAPEPSQTAALGLGLLGLAGLALKARRRTA